MCVNFIPLPALDAPKVDMPIPTFSYPEESFPGYAAPLIIPINGQTQWREARFGLIPTWAKDEKIGRHTYNARLETIDTKSSFKMAWQKRQFALLPITAFFEPKYDEAGKASRWRVNQVNNVPFTVAALWDTWSNPKNDQRQHTFTLLTRNSDEDALLSQFHKPDDEKRSIIIVPPECRNSWLYDVTPQEMAGFLHEIQIPKLVATVSPKRQKKANPSLHPTLF